MKRICKLVLIVFMLTALTSCVLRAGNAAIQRGSALFQQKKFDEARTYFEQALKEESTYSADLIYILISNCYSQQLDYDNALLWRQKALELDPDNADNYLNMAFLYRLKHDDDSAEKLFSKALELDPEDPAPYASLASLYLTTNREEEALQMLLKANELNDNIAIVHADMAVCYARMGHFANAEEELEIAQELHVDNFNLFKQEIDALKDLAQ